MRIRVAVFASGNGTNAERLFEFYRDHPSIKIELLFCNNPQAQVIIRAEKWLIPVILFDRQELMNSQVVQNTLKVKEIDWIALAGFLWLLPSNILSDYPNKIVNLHPALLPKYGGKGMYGRHVHEAVINSGDNQSGITIHMVDEEYDRGRIVFQAKCEVEQHDTPESLAEKIHELEYEYLPTTLEKLILEEEP